ncbi:hypothetical protein NXC14_CH00001 [Rhizobium sp. NXC14]|nr:hypothetical protein NXC14_CH00001 [Rhizobium sp. NXC14]
MKEVRSVLHVIFRCLLKRLDDGELRRRGCLGQGKTCLLIHISNLPDRFRPLLWRLGMKSTCRPAAHSLSTGTKKLVLWQEFGIAFGFGFSPEFDRNGEILSSSSSNARQMASAVDGF